MMYTMMGWLCSLSCVYGVHTDGLAWGYTCIHGVHFYIISFFISVLSRDSDFFEIILGVFSQWPGLVGVVIMPKYV